MTHDELMQKHHKILNTTGGLEVSLGWYTLIDALCDDLQALTDNFYHQQVEAIQVKSKFGGLRFYTKGHSDSQEVRINNAERDSYQTCEMCGKPGKQHSTRGWVRTVCDAHSE